MKKFSISVPATSTNLGPGFDCLSVALPIFLNIKGHISNNFKITATGNYTDGISLKKDNLIYKIYSSLYKKLNKKNPPLLDLSVNNNIPLERGLGSSAAAIVAGCYLAYAVSGKKPDKQKIFEVSSKIEGHPDNTGAAIFGGFCVNKMTPHKCANIKLNIPYKINFNLIIPQMHINTSNARKILPQKYSRSNVIETLTSLAMIMCSFSSGNWEMIDMCSDQIHEKYRLSYSKDLKNLYQMIKKIPDTYSYLSGSGPVICVLDKNKNRNIISKEILTIIKKQRLQCRLKTSVIFEEGTKCI